MKIRKGDRVVVLSGKDRGKEGEVSFVSPKDGRIIVDGVNISKKHQRPTRETMQGGIIDKEMPIQTSKLMPICPSCSKPTRIGYQILKDGTKSRMCKKCEGMFS